MSIMINCKEKINYQGNLYVVKKKIKQSQINSELIDSLKNYWDCDLVLKQNNTEEKYLLFLILIPIAEVVEFIPK